MYRIFCESYDNYMKMIGKDNARVNIAKPFALIIDKNRYENEKNNNSEIYKKISDLIWYMQENIKRFPKFKAFLWTLESRNMIGRNYQVESKEQLEEQAKLINSFLKLAYWN